MYCARASRCARFYSLVIQLAEPVYVYAIAIAIALSNALFNVPCMIAHACMQ